MRHQAVQLHPHHVLARNHARYQEIDPLLLIMVCAYRLAHFFGKGDVVLFRRCRIPGTVLVKPTSSDYTTLYDKMKFQAVRCPILDISNITYRLYWLSRV